MAGESPRQPGNTGLSFFSITVTCLESTLDLKVSVISASGLLPQEEVSLVMASSVCHSILINEGQDKHYYLSTRYRLNSLVGIPQDCLEQVMIKKGRNILQDLEMET